MTRLSCKDQEDFRIKSRIVCLEQIQPVQQTTFAYNITISYKKGCWALSNRRVQFAPHILYVKYKVSKLSHIMTSHIKCHNLSRPQFCPPQKKGQHRNRTSQHLVPEQFSHNILFSRISSWQVAVESHGIFQTAFPLALEECHLS